MRSLVFANLHTRKPAIDANGATYAFPVMPIGQQWTLSFRFLNRIDGEITEIYPVIRSIRAAVGNIDARPAGGAIKLQVGEGTSTEANTISVIDAAISAKTLTDKLNALSGIAPHDFSVEFDSGSYLIRRDDGSDFDLTVTENRLRPVSFVQFHKWNTQDGWMTEMRFVQSPLAFTDSSAQVLPDEPYADTVFDGYTDETGTTKVNEVQQIVFPPEFRGQYYLTLPPAIERSPLLSLSDGEEEIKAALDKILTLQGGSALVSNTDDGKARVEFTGELSGIDVSELVVTVPPEGAPPGDWTITLDFNTLESWAALRGAKEGKIKVPFEVEIDVPEDPNDEESPSRTIKLWQEDITLVRPLNTEGMATAQPVGWLRKPSPKKYLPYNSTQLGIGQLYYEQSLGDGEETNFEIDHNLGVVALTGLRVIELATGRVLRDSEYSAVSANEGNTLEMTFVTAPESVLVTLSTPQPIEYFINDLEIEIAQVLGLQDVINNLTSRVVDLEELIPTVSGVVDASSDSLLIELPKTKEVLFYKGVAELFDEDGLDITKLPTSRPPLLLPACHDASTTNATAVPDDAAANSGSVFKNNAAPELIVAPGSGMPPAVVKQNEFFASDGRVFYKTSRFASTNSYYPQPFERQLFAVPTNADMLGAGRKLVITFAVKVQLAKADCTAKWVLYVDVGVAAGQTTPDPVGVNLDTIQWSATPVFTRSLDVMSEAWTHPFGIAISRSASNVMTLDQMLYAKWNPNNAAAPADANFVVRARLIQFDTANDAPKARGWLSYQLVPPPGEGSKLQAIITS